MCDTLFRRGLSNINSCKLPFVVSLLGAAICTALAAYTSRGLFAVGYISLSLLMINSASSAAWAMATVAAPQNYAASLGSIQNFGGYFGGAMAPIVTGYMVQLTGSFRSALLVASVVALFAGAGHLLFVRKPISLRWQPNDLTVLTFSRAIPLDTVPPTCSNSVDNRLASWFPKEEWLLTGGA